MDDYRLSDWYDGPAGSFWAHRLVDRFHVATPIQEVLLKVVRKFRASTWDNLTGETAAALVWDLVAAHMENRGMYNEVMGGRL